MSTETTSSVRWLAGILFSVIFAAISWLCGVAMKHEGAIGRWDNQLSTIQRALERLEQKLDALGGK